MKETQIFIWYNKDVESWLFTSRKTPRDDFNVENNISRYWLRLKSEGKKLKCRVFPDRHPQQDRLSNLFVLILDLLSRISYEIGFHVSVDQERPVHEVS